MKDFIELVRHISLFDFFDVLIVSYIIYRFLLIVRGTRAVPMLLGLGALASLYWISYSYDMYALNWILTNFFEYFFILVVILFQDEIRVALITFSGTNFFRRKDMSEFEKVVDEVLEASNALKSEKTGAIIVIERDNGLLNYAQTGSILGAKMSSDLIYTIFQKKSPLHDGAIIISQGKIQAVGCLLPLSNNIQIERHYGTRHRAALGISEATDALAIVVSEEKRDLKICFKGEFFYANDEEGLRELIFKLYYDEKTMHTTLRKAGA